MSQQKGHTDFSGLVLFVFLVEVEFYLRKTNNKQIAR